MQGGLQKNMDMGQSCCLHQIHCFELYSIENKWQYCLLRTAGSETVEQSFAAVPRDLCYNR